MSLAGSPEGHGDHPLDLGKPTVPGGCRRSLATRLPAAPPLPLLDRNGEHVLDSGLPVSTMETRGACHDAAFIADHSSHVRAGWDQVGEPGSPEGGRPWEIGSGLYGGWDPLTNRYSSPPGDELLDLGTPEWLRTLGIRHVGGGPAAYSRDGQRLEDLPPDAGDPVSASLDPGTGQPAAWDWAQSGVVEMNCLLCHIEAPDNTARQQALQRGDFGWANSATLAATGLIEAGPAGYIWQASGFDEAGNALPGRLNIQDPENRNCGLCHGLVEDELEEPLVFFGCRPEASRTVTTGQIISPERLSDTGMNLSGKDELRRAWDVHAERQVSCTDCHYSLNNPVYFQQSATARPDHLSFDPRRLELREYLYQPLHEFASGGNPQAGIDSESSTTMRGCEACRSLENTHNWLPYKARHVEALACEACHIETMYATALQQYDWTVVDPVGSPATVCRGIEGQAGDPRSVITGFAPVLLERGQPDGSTRLAPCNLITSWYWVYGDPPRPVRQIDLRAAWLDGDDYAVEVLDTFDRDGDRQLSRSERMLDSPRSDRVALCRFHRGPRLSDDHRCETTGGGEGHDAGLGRGRRWSGSFGSSRS